MTTPMTPPDGALSVLLYRESLYHGAGSGFLGVGLGLAALASTGGGMPARLPPPPIEDLHPVPVEQRLAVAKTILGDVDVAAYEKPTSTSRQRKITSCRTLFEAWVDLPLEDGGAGLGVDVLGELNVDAIAVVAYRYLQWLLAPVPDDHLLLTFVPAADGRRRRQRATGGRGKPEAMRPGTINGHRYGVLQSIAAVTDAAAAAAILDRVWPHSPTSEWTPVPRTRIDFTPEAALAYAEALRAEVLAGQHQGLKPGQRHTTAFHARQLAAFTTQLWGVLRISELGRLYDTTCRPLTKADEVIGLEFRLGRTKPGPGRDVVLPVIAGHPLCPVTAIVAWHEAAADAGYDRQGLTLPLVVARPQANAVRKPDSTSEGVYFQALTAAAGLDELRTTSGVLAGDALSAHEKDEVTFGTHSLRRLLVSQAAAAGRDIGFMLNLGGGGAWRDPEAASMVHSYIGISDASAQMAVLEGSDS